jgi:hypothetical protein
VKKFYVFYSLLFTMMILITSGNADAFSTGDREGVPEGLTTTEWTRMQASVERDQYRLRMGHDTGEYLAPNAVHGFRATFAQESFEVGPRTERPAWSWGLRLNRYGYGSLLQAVPAVDKVTTKDNRIEYHRGDMVEWYINDRRGIEQGFTLKSRPDRRAGGGLLQLQMKASGDLLSVLEMDEKGIVLKDAQGKEVLRYSGLYAYDAAGKDLEARMAADPDGIRLIVADQAAIYPITIDPFIESKKLMASDGAGAVGDNFGYSVSISGDTVIVGAQYDGDNGNRAGAAFIFSRNQGGWVQVQKLTAGDGAEDDQFGTSVSISGDTAIVGAPWNNGPPPDETSNLGAAYIFSRNEGGADNWGQVQKLTAGDAAYSDAFGYSVSISGDTAIVGAKWADATRSNSGAAYIFYRNEGGTDNWGQFQKIARGAYGDMHEYLGTSVAISGDTAIAGAPGYDGYGAGTGAAFIYSRDQDGTDNWGEVKMLTASDHDTGDLFGTSVSISGDTAIVGSPENNDNGTDSGAAYIFSRNQGGADIWGQVQKLLPSDGGDSYDLFGYGVSISGDTAIAGCYQDDDKGGNSGSAYTFSRNQGGTDNWGEVNKLLAGDGDEIDLFGYSVSIDGDTAIVGAKSDEDNGNFSGSAYLFVPGSAGGMPLIPLLLLGD